MNKNFTTANLNNWQKKMIKNIEFKHNIFVYLDHLNLGEWEILYSRLDNHLQVLIFEKPRKTGYNLKAATVEEFLIRFKMVKEIRNAIAHNNSLTILTRFRNTRKNIIRHDTERKKFVRVINMLKTKTYLY